VSKLLYADLTNGKLRRSLGGAEFSFGTLPHIGVQSIGLRFSKQIGDRHVEIYPTVNEIRGTIGPLDARPEAGQFSLKVGSGSPVVGTNVTTLLDFDSTADEIATALNVLTVVGTAVVVEDDDSFLVTGTSVGTITVYENTLRPITFVRVKSYEVNGATTQAIRLQRAPFAFTDVSDQRVPTPPSVERIQTGATVDGTIYPEIQKLTIPLEFNGSYRLRRSDPVRKSALLGVADGPDEVAAAINPTSDSVGLGDDADSLFVVEEHPTDPAFLISFLGGMEGDSPDLLAVDVFDPPPGDWWIHLNPQTAPTEEALRDTDLLRRVPIEIHADLEIDGEASRSYCLYQGECSIKESISHEDLGTVHAIDWINPPTAKVYKPVEADSLSSGTRFYPFLIGDGSDIVFLITHNLDSPRVRVALRENTSGGLELVHGTDYQVEYDSNNALTITLLGTYASSPPASEALTGTVQDLTLTSTWLDPTVPIANVTGLQDLIDAIMAELAELRAGNFGGNAPVVSTMSTNKIDRPLPRVWNILRARTLPDAPGTLAGWNPFAEGSTLRDIRLLPAVHLDADDIEALPAVLPAAADSYRDRIFYASVDVPGICVAGQYVACSGLEWYRVRRESESESTWYPTAMEMEFFRLSISPDELALRTRLDLAIGLEMALYDPSRRPADRRTVGRMSLILERGVRTSDSTPATTGSNISSHFGSAVILAQHDFDLTSVPTQKKFTLSVARDGAGALTALASKMMGAAVTVSAPSSADFALRLRLGRVDFENLPTDGRGILAVRGPDVGLDGQVDQTVGRYGIA
jgi:hypothetical protein